MFSHIMIGANDIEISKKFYDATLAAIGLAPGSIDSLGRAVYATATGILIISKPIDGKPATAANGGTIAFAASSTIAIDDWHSAGIANRGTSCEDSPGVRHSEYGDMYVAYLRDPAGNKLCALTRL